MHDTGWMIGTAILSPIIAVIALPTILGITVGGFALAKGLGFEYDPNKVNDKISKKLKKTNPKAEHKGSFAPGTSQKVLSIRNKIDKGLKTVVGWIPFIGDERRTSWKLKARIIANQLVRFGTKDPMIVRTFQVPPGATALAGYFFRQTLSVFSHLVVGFLLRKFRLLRRIPFVDRWLNNQTARLMTKAGIPHTGRPEDKMEGLLKSLWHTLRRKDK